MAGIHAVRPSGTACCCAARRGWTTARSSARGPQGARGVGLRCSFATTSVSPTYVETSRKTDLASCITWSPAVERAPPGVDGAGTACETMLCVLAARSTPPSNAACDTAESGGSEDARTSSLTGLSCVSCQTHQHAHTTTTAGRIPASRAAPPAPGTSTSGCRVGLPAFALLQNLHPLSLEDVSLDRLFTSNG